MKSDGELMEILNAYDLTGSYRAAGEGSVPWGGGLRIGVCSRVVINESC